MKGSMGSTLFGCEMEERVCNLNRRSCHLASLSKVQVQYKLPFNRGRLQKGQNPVHHKNEWKSCVVLSVLLTTETVFLVHQLDCRPGCPADQLLCVLAAGGLTVEPTDKLTYFRSPID